MLTEVHRQAQDDPIVRLSMEMRAGQRLDARRLRRDAGGARATNSIRSACSRPTRCWSGATSRGAPTMRACASAAASTIRCRSRATSWSACATTARRACSTAGSGGEGAPATRQADPEAAADAGRRRARQGREGLGAAGMLHRQDRGDRLAAAQAYDEFDYGYVLTVHKAQGSQWDDVVLFDESFAFQESRERWLYTGITRAAKRLTVVSSISTCAPLARLRIVHRERRTPQASIALGRGPAGRRRGARDRAPGACRSSPRELASSRACRVGNRPGPPLRRPGRSELLRR